MWLVVVVLFKQLYVITLCASTFLFNLVLESKENKHWIKPLCFNKKSTAVSALYFGFNVVS